MWASRGGLEVQELGHSSGVDPARIGIHGDFHSIGEGRRGLLQVHEGGDLKFPGQRRHVAADTAGIGDDGLGLVHDHDELGGRMLGHEDPALGETAEIVFGMDLVHLAAPHAGIGGFSALQQQLVARELFIDLA